MPEPKLVRLRERGQVTLPAGIRRRFGLKKGDLVAIVEMEDGVLIAPQEVIAARALDQIGQLLRDQDLSLEDLIESGREERVQIIAEERGAGREGANA